MQDQSPIAHEQVVDFAQTSSSNRITSKGIEFYTVKNVEAVGGPELMGSRQIPAASSTLSVNGRSSIWAAFVDLAPPGGSFRGGYDVEPDRSGHRSASWANSQSVS